MISLQYMDNITYLILNYMEVKLQLKVARAMVDSGSDYCLRRESSLSLKQKQCLLWCDLNTHNTTHNNFDE